MRAHRDSGDVAIQPVELILPQSFSPACSACTQRSQHKCIMHAQMPNIVYTSLRLVRTPLKGVFASFLLCTYSPELKCSYIKVTVFLLLQLLLNWYFKASLHTWFC